MQQTSVWALLGGLFAAILASPMLLVAGVPEWPALPAAVGWIGVIAALGALAAAGNAAGGGAAHGALVGWLGGWLAWGLVGSPAAALIGGAGMAASAAAGPGGDLAVVAPLGQAAVMTAWMSYGSFWAAGLLGAAAGAAGGARSGVGTLPRGPSLGVAALAWLTVASLVAVIAPVATDPLQQKIGERIADGSLTTSLPAGGLFGWSVATPVLQMGLAIAAAGLFAGAGLRADASVAERRDARLLVGLCAFFPLATLLLLGLRSSAVLVQPVFLLPLALSALIAAAGMMRGARPAPDPVRVEPLGTGLFAGLLLAGGVLGSGLGYTLGLGLVVLPYIEPIARGSLLAPAAPLGGLAFRLLLAHWGAAAVLTLAGILAFGGLRALARVPSPAPV